eukprot:TRINITY_DN6550_c0_g1_i2.p1 TRINITY_DN6550_c0_g1~~TRINITY_DN6550_c0_g1_i2.p1  ORF type:complete len:197 (+),score=25.58 TRINITY_DN6550_c0_g1_i2:134-724(+)
MSLDILATTSSFSSYVLECDALFRCDAKDCSREFKSKRNLVDHYRGHHQGSKPHTCSYPGCEKSFLRPAHLLIHTRIHTGEKPFVCDFEGCGKRWNQKSALKQHKRSHTGEKPFACTVEGCDKRFSTSSSCKRHVQTHGRTRDEEVCLLSQKRKLCFDDMEEQPNIFKRLAVCFEQQETILVDDVKKIMAVNFLLN